MNNNFEQSWNQLSQKYRDAKCPKSNEEINEILSNIASKNMKSSLKVFKINRMVRWTLIAACVFSAVVLTTIVFHSKDAVQVIEVNGEEAYYLSNNNNSAENTIEMFNSIIH